ncbi:MAG TPA: hypothetical protein PLS69_12770, partial [Terricaulis sp.]|nr:hypothetical protein [Terricaulis sp.]
IADSLKVDVAELFDAEKALFAEVENAVREQLRDPRSAIFRNVRRVATRIDPNAHVVCGEVNSRNGFGGYAGFRMFAVDNAGVTFEDETARRRGVMRLLGCRPGDAVTAEEKAFEEEFRRWEAAGKV